MIEKCNVCNADLNKSKTIHSYLKNLVGIDSDYTQHVCLCEKCGFIFVKNPLGQDLLDLKYKNFSKYEFDNKESVVQSGYARRCKAQKSFVANSLAEESFDSILEIGAASGYNLSLYKDKDLLGIEPSKANCESAMKNYNVEMFPGTFAEYLALNKEKKFDLIFLSHTLEHIVNPLDFIKQCSLINEKYFFIEVPSFDYKLKDEPFGMFTDEHVNMFTFESLQNLMNNAGYEVVNAEIPFCIGDIAPSGYPALRTLWQKSANIKKIEPVFSSETLFSEYINWSSSAMKKIQSKIDSIDKNAKVALWGIGNTAARILGATSIETKNIVRTYDSDKRKHGLFFAGAAISAFSEEDIKNSIVDTIVITTCTAQNKLLSILKKYEDKIKIVTLFEV